MMKLKKLLIVILIPLVSTLSYGQAGKPDNGKGILRAGIAKTDVTPSIPVKLYGYASRKTYSEGVHDPLSARVVVFENNGRKIVLVSTDIGSYGSEVFTVFQKSIMEKFGLKESELFLSTIHSHSSPVLSLNTETGDPNNIEYTKTFQQKLLNVIGEAMKNMKPVQTGAGTGSSPVGANRREMKPDGSITLGRNPYGITDKEVQVMKITTADGAPVGALYDYATHSTSLGPRNMQISGDVLGLSAQFVEKILGEDVITPVFSGAAGNNVEMLTEIGMEIKAGSPFRHTFIITHCNGASGYLVPAELYKEGGYEPTTTRFEIGSSDMVIKKALRMLYDLN
jgi:predicted ThiF/HesA family dinucleotide-utilizing enzyme